MWRVDEKREKHCDFVGGIFLLVDLWVLGLLSGYPFGGLIYILLVYAGLVVISRLIERCRILRAGEHLS